MQTLIKASLIAIFILVLSTLILITTGCAANNSPPLLETTMLDSVDLQRMTDQMVASLLTTKDLNLKSSVIVTDRVVNRTNHLMHPGEKELFLTRLRSHLAQVESLKNLDVVFVARPDEVSAYSPSQYENNISPEAGPTHVLTATFRTLTNVTRSIRSDYYECAFQLTELKSRRIVWEDAYNVEYAVSRSKFN